MHIYTNLLFVISLKFKFNWTSRWYPASQRPPCPPQAHTQECIKNRKLTPDTGNNTKVFGKIALNSIMQNGSPRQTSQG